MRHVIDWRLGAAESISAAMSAGFFVYQRLDDGRLHLCHANPAGLEIASLQERETHAAALTDLFPEAGEFEAKLLGVLQSQAPLTLEAYRYADEERTTLTRIEAFPLSIEHVGIIFDDLAPMREVNERLQRYVAQLDANNRELASFARVASHDLQEPLRKIVTFGERLQTRAAGLLDERSSDYLARMVAASERLSKLIEHLREYTRLSGSPTHRTSVDMGELIEEVIEDLELAIEEANVTIEIGELPTIRGDRLLLHRLFQNLLQNAVKYRHPERPAELRIVGRLRRSGPLTWAEFEVRDNGIGFEPGNAERIFGLFQRLHPRSRYEGTGLGLAIARRVASAHGGRVFASGSAGDGATFTVELPSEGALPEGLPHD